MNDEYLKLDFTDLTATFVTDRREFLKILGAGLFVFVTVGDEELLAQERRRGGSGQRMPADFNAFLKIGEDGSVSCFTGKIEMGQGVITSLAQMLADELNVSLESVDMVMGDTDLCPWDMGTFGSMSTRFFGPPLRAAAAEARAVLLADGRRATPDAGGTTERGGRRDLPQGTEGQASLVRRTDQGEENRAASEAGRQAGGGVRFHDRRPSRSCARMPRTR